MRVVSWNMAYWSHRATHDRAWRWVIEALQPDILLCQECVPPDWVKAERNVVWDEAYPDSKQPWGTGIVTNLPCKRARIDALDDWLGKLPPAVPGKHRSFIYRADGWVAAAKLEMPQIGETLVASIHNPAFAIEQPRLEGVDITPMRLKLNKDLWLLDVLFHYLRPLLGSRLLVGGDFNYSRLLDPPKRPRGNNEFFDRLAAEGFVSLHRRFHDRDSQTFFKKNGREHQLDYLYADEPVARYATACRAHPYDDVTELSDHSPLVADLTFNV